MWNTHTRRLETAGTTDEAATNRQLRCDGGTPRATGGGSTVPDDTEASDPTLHPAETWHDCSGVQRDLLRVLHVLDAPTGLAIKRRLSTCYGTDICNAHLYQTLDQLVDAGLVTKGQQDGRTNAYDLTDRGLAALQARDELLQGGPDGRPAHSDDKPTDADLVTDGGEVEQLTADGTLRLTDEGIEMPEWLRGYTGEFTIEDGSVTGTLTTEPSGLPDTDIWDGVLAVMPTDGDYNPEIPAGHWVITAPGKPRYCYAIDDERSEVADD